MVFPNSLEDDPILVILMSLGHPHVDTVVAAALT